MICTTCNRPADAGYVNEAALEACSDPVHDRYGVRVIPGSWVGRTWLVEQLHPSGSFYMAHGSYSTLAGAQQAADALACAAAVGELGQAARDAANAAANCCRVTEELREEARRYYSDASYRESLPWSEQPS